MRFKRERYQYGCLTREGRKKKPCVWIFRWRENWAEGRINRKVVVGTVQQYPTKADALKAVESLRIRINSENAAPLTIKQLVAHYLEKELPSKTYSTSQVYRICLEKWVLPAWGTHGLAEIRTVAVESWLGTLPLANATKAKIRNVMSALFNHAIRYEWLERNPITHVRQSAKRERIPDILTAAELRKLICELPQPFSTMVFLASTTGLRRSELLALKWVDIDFESAEINLRQAIVQQVLGKMKTEASQKLVPIEGTTADYLLDWHARSVYNQPRDWVFASPRMDGRQPYWPENLLKRHIRPAARRAGITKQIGWHSFRRTFGTLLKACGEDVKTTQELMRHANSRITLDVYVQALTPAKRSAQEKMAQLIRPLFPSVPTRISKEVVND